jgi:2,3-bisphosphoglycerate-independent phosphoglycerate mutase
LNYDIVRAIAQPATTKIVLLVMDGLGGLPHPATGRSELETASTPNLDRLAAEGMCGLTVPVGPGITPGSGPGHLALFGYDPVAHDIGRGVLEAVGIDFPLDPNDVAARGNFCTVDGRGDITDRRAGRIPTDLCRELCAALSRIEVPGVQFLVEPVREHRFVLVARGERLSDSLAGTDPQREGVPPLPVTAKTGDANATADAFNAWIDQARNVLAGQDRANMLLVRGFAKHPSLVPFPKTFGLRAAAIAVYPMYRGLAKLAGMTALSGGAGFLDEVTAAKDHWDEFDYFFLHYKKTDAAGEDGDFDRKVAAIEELDRELPALLDLQPDVVMVAGDHSTPAIMAAHSWHPVPFVLRGPLARADDAQAFTERECRRGAFGVFPATDVMGHAMAHAGRLTKFGA